MRETMMNTGKHVYRLPQSSRNEDKKLYQKNQPTPKSTTPKTIHPPTSKYNEKEHQRPKSILRRLEKKYENKMN
jgi:hypothetical protein